MANQWEAPAKKVGSQVVKHLWNYYANPGAYSNAASVAAEPAYNMGAAGMEAGTGVGSGVGASAFGEGGVGMSTGAWASVLAPLVMGYLKYQAGSGRNEPLEKSYMQRNAAKTLYDMAGGAEAPTRGAYFGQGLSAKLPDWMTGQNTMGGEGIAMDDPRKMTAYSLYDELHRLGQGHKAQNGTGQGGWNDQEADAMFGDRRDAVARLLGVDSLQDWTNRRYDDPSRPGEVTPWTIGNPEQNKLDEGWNALSDEEKAGYQNKAYSRYNTAEAGPGVDAWTRGLYDREAQQAEVEKILGYKIGNNQAYEGVYGGI